MEQRNGGHPHFLAYALRELTCVTTVTCCVESHSTELAHSKGIGNQSPRFLSPKEKRKDKTPSL